MTDDVHSAEDEATPDPEARVLPILDDRVHVSPWEPGKRENWVRVGVLAFTVLIFLPNLGSFGLWDPWETHYGAVTTNMVETHDWVSPWWGYKEKIGDEAQQGRPFFSKPILIFWTEAIASRVIGRGEWAVRLPMALLAMLAVFMAYLVMSRIWSRRVGLIGAVVIATSPEFFMISRQAQTDMPFVGTMVLALGFFMLAVFGPRTRSSDRRFWVWTGVTLAFVLLNTIPQYLLINMDMSPEVPAKLEGMKRFLWVLWHDGTSHGIIFSLALTGLLVWYGLALSRDVKKEGLTERLKDRWLRRYLLIGFYVLAAHSTYAKGLLGFLLPGGILLFYLLLTNTWRILARAELLRGIGIFLVVGLPWYLAMGALHGSAYIKRFFIHDHINRLASGVHQIDSGTFEHFIKWLGIGLWPWAAFVPLCFVWVARTRSQDRSAPNQARFFLVIWFVFAFSLFTIASTKFHHYIFPAMPALGMLIALFIDHLLKSQGSLPRLAALVGLVFFFAIAANIKADKQHIRNLMTYKYDRPMPKHLPIDPDGKVNTKTDVTWKDSTFFKHTSGFQKSILTASVFRYDTWMWVLMVLGGLGLGLFFFARTRNLGFGALAMMAVALAMWSLNYYMPMLSPHWSQKYLFDSYYDTCTRETNTAEVDQAYRPWLVSLGMEGLASYFRYHPKRVCQEDVISWRITWRGETYYSYNELQPITKEAKQFQPYLEERNHAQKFYALMERGSHTQLKSKLDRATAQLRRKGLNALRTCKSRCAIDVKCKAACDRDRSPWSDVTTWKVKIENGESAYFQMVSATPQRSDKPLR